MDSRNLSVDFKSVTDAENEELMYKRKTKFTRIGNNKRPARMLPS